MTRARVLLLICFVAFLLALRVFFYFSSLKPFADGETVVFYYLLLKEPTVEGKFQRFSALPTGREKIFITTPSYPKYSYGQGLQIKGVIKRQEIKEENAKNGSSSSGSLLRGKNVVNSMFFPSIEAKKNDWLTPLSMLRKNLITIFSQSLSPASESLLLGIVFGIRGTMPRELADDLRTTGVIHITAASGMNVTMVAGAVFFLLAGFLKRQVAILAGFLFVWLYAVLAGLEPSILRASIMSSFAFGAGLMGRQNTGILTLLLTASVMLFLTPSLLVDAGFLLSCFSTLGIILFGQVVGGGGYAVDPLQKKEESFFGAFRQDMQTTLAAQAGTLPILFVYFGQYNILSVVVNALILWTIPILMIFGAVGALFGLLFKPLAAPVLYLSLPLLAYVEYVVRFFAQYPVYMQIENISILFVIGYYCFFLSIYLFFRSKRT